MATYFKLVSIQNKAGREESPVGAAPARMSAPAMASRPEDSATVRTVARGAHLASPPAHAAQPGQAPAMCVAGVMCCWRYVFLALSLVNITNHNL